MLIVYALNICVATSFDIGFRPTLKEVITAMSRKGGIVFLTRRASPSV